MKSLEAGEGRRVGRDDWVGLEVGRGGGLGASVGQVLGENVGSIVSPSSEGRGVRGGREGLGVGVVVGSAVTGTGVGPLVRIVGVRVGVLVVGRKVGSIVSPSNEGRGVRGEGANVDSAEGGGVLGLRVTLGRFGRRLGRMVGTGIKSSERRFSAMARVGVGVEPSGEPQKHPSPHSTKAPQRGGTAGQNLRQDMNGRTSGVPTGQVAPSSVRLETQSGF